MSVIDIIATIGGGAGIVALAKVGIDVFFAKSNKTTIDLKNMQEMLNESHRLFNEAVSRYESLEKRIEDDRTKSHQYIDSLRKRIESTEGDVRMLHKEINSLQKVVNIAWTCRYPEKIESCPVVQKYEKLQLCEECDSKCEQ